MESFHDVDSITTDTNTAGRMNSHSGDEIASASLTDDDRKVCATCGDPVDVTKRHPVAANVEGEEVDVYLFCSEACRNRWGRTDERP